MPAEKLEAWQLALLQALKKLEKLQERLQERKDWVGREMASIAAQHVNTAWFFLESHANAQLTGEELKAALAEFKRKIEL